MIGRAPWTPGANVALMERMDAQINEWDEEEPRDDWWRYQQDHAAALDLIKVYSESAPEMAEALRWIVSDSHSLEAAMAKARAILAKIGAA